MARPCPNQPLLGEACAGGKRIWASALLAAGVCLVAAAAQAANRQLPGLRDLGDTSVRGFEQKIRLYTLDPPRSRSFASAL